MGWRTSDNISFHVLPQMDLGLSGFGCSPKGQFWSPLIRALPYVCNVSYMASSKLPTGLPWTFFSPLFHEGQIYGVQLIVDLGTDSHPELWISAAPLELPWSSCCFLAVSLDGPPCLGRSAGGPSSLHLQMLG
ncbi:hypothetical protein XENOCAPTIV_000386 [Xenoophorus captivus]|uniref:Uncharacterized protein n=1 Tax=Xenoophorus captivus TaxID=1517983 RepID=A0ABV0SCF6_9TELE